MQSSDELKQAILLTLSKIPVGKVSTYGDIAKRAGLPGHARYVGRILKTLPPESSIPWHRVISANGRISLPENSPSYVEQIQRLKSENINVKQGKVRLSHYRW